MTTKDAATTEPAKSQASAIGLPKKNLIIIGVITLAVWAFAIQTGSWILMSIVGVLTLVLLGLLFWAFRIMNKQRRLASLLEGAVASPEARKEALAAISTGKDAKEAPQVFARAQLEAADDPKKALETIETLEISKVPAQMQDDVALLRAQLYLRFGRPKDARPMVDRINVDNPQRKDARPLMVAIVTESWARTGKHEEALKLLETVDPDIQKDEGLRAQLIMSRIFARFAAGKKPGAKKDLMALAALDVNYLGRFVLPQFRAHPELQRMARSVAEANPQMRKLAKQQTPRAPRRWGR